jgi:hypothetical protein
LEIEAIKSRYWVACSGVSTCGSDSGRETVMGHEAARPPPPDDDEEETGNRVGGGITGELGPTLAGGSSPPPVRTPRQSYEARKSLETTGSRSPTSTMRTSPSDGDWNVST